MGISITVDLFHHYQKLRELIGQFAVVDESKDNVARVNLSRTERIVLFDVAIVATVMTITVVNKRTDHTKPLPSC